METTIEHNCEQVVNNNHTMTPTIYRVEKNRRDTHDTFTLHLSPEDQPLETVYEPGQFNMLYAFGVGEVPISISGDTTEWPKLVHTIRAVGSVTNALQSLATGDSIGVRGPYGKPWPVEATKGKDIILVAGGIGLAPLRPAIYQILHNRESYGKVILLYGSRRPLDILFRKELEKWRSRLDMFVDVTVDSSDRNWNGNVGVVPRLIDTANFDPIDTAAFVCGPEVMMRFTAMALNKRGVSSDNIYVSLERNMKCGVGLCGHCQMSNQFICKDGPVYTYSQVRETVLIREI